MKTILTGDRPTGRLHLGHYFGSVENRVKLQNDYDTYILIADVQALTDNFNNPEKVRKSVYNLALDYLGCGIDPKQSHIYIQSLIPEVAELTVYFSNLVTVPRLYRNPTTKHELLQKKEVFGESGEGITYGFLGYPVSQAADIACVNSNLVPVGEDQLPHIEQTREILRKFNNIYGETFNIPEPVLSTSPRIKGLDGNEKMSKSLNNCIYLSDDADTITKKVMTAVTDPDKIRKDDPANPDKCMVYYYHKLIRNKDVDTVCEECKKGERGCVYCKKELARAIIEFLKPIQERRKYYEDRPEEVEKILKEGTLATKRKAEEVMKKVRKNMNLDYFE
ncbi:MAG: tryptophan--tRNA ligase [bacterium]|nr:tryptophan--tRNA ligase [bacterium]